MTWAPGDVVADLYQVRAVHGDGAMGLVHRVRHLGWGVDLAVKSPRPELFVDDEDRRRFVAEAETWVALGLHPHVCACHYVRTLDGVPRVFAEYAAGGSLRDRIADGRLYAGAAGDVLARLLDAAVQVAWGLAHAHAHGVAHLDVKPANVLLDARGVAKVTDFGLARAGRSSGAGGTGAGTVLATVGGLTPAYASPEQAAGRRVGRRSDVWSFAVSVLHLFAGDVTWLSGPAAGAALDGRGFLVPLPPSVAGVLADCLRDRPADRPSSMTEVADRLAGAYRHELGRPYPRVAPRTVERRADALNNRALSLLDLGRTDAARTAFDEARAVDPHHLEATYNLGLLRWRTGEIRDDDVLGELAPVAASRVGARRLLDRVHAERGGPPRPLPGSGAGARHLAMSAAGGVAAAGDDAGDVRVWHLESGRRPHVVDHVGLTALTVSGDGGTLATGGRDGRVRVWDTARGGPRGRLDGLGGPVTGLWLSPGGHLAAARRPDGGSRVWQVSTGRPLRALAPGTIVAAAFRADGALVTLAPGGALTTWDVRTGRPTGTVHVDRSARTLALSADGRTAVTAGNGVAGAERGAARVWDLTTGAPGAVLLGPREAMAVLAVGGRFAVDGGDGRCGVRLWHVDTGQCVHTVDGFPASAGVAISADGRRALFARSAEVHVWDLPARPAPAAYELCRPRGHVELTSVDERAGELLDAGERALAAGDHAEAHRSVAAARALPGWERAPRSLRAWRRLVPQLRRTGVRGVWDAGALPGSGTDAVVALSATGRTAVSGGRDGVRVWDVERRRLVRALDAGPVRSVALAADGTVVAGRADGGVQVWHAGTGRFVRALDGHEGAVTSVSVAGELAVTGGMDGAVKVWELASGRCLRTYPEAVGPLVHVGLGAGGRRVLSASVRPYSRRDGQIVARDHTVRVRDVDTGEHLRDLVGGRTFGMSNTHTEAVTAACFGADATTVLTGAEDTTVRVWRLDAGECVRALRGHRYDVRALALTGDCAYAVSGDDAGAVRLWDLTDGRCLRVLDAHQGAVTSLAVGADGRVLVTSGAGVARLRVWEVDWTLAPP